MFAMVELFLRHDDRPSCRTVSGINLNLLQCVSISVPISKAHKLDFQSGRNRGCFTVIKKKCSVVLLSVSSLLLYVNVVVIVCITAA